MGNDGVKWWGYGCDEKLYWYYVLLIVLMIVIFYIGLLSFFIKLFLDG